MRYAHLCFMFQYIENLSDQQNKIKAGLLVFTVQYKGDSIKYKGDRRTILM